MCAWIRNQNNIHDVIHLLKTRDNHSVTLWIRNQNNIHDVIHLLKTRDNHSVTLWCMGHSATPTVPPTGSKRPRNTNYCGLVW